MAKAARTAFVDDTPVFTLRDIGSKIIDQLSTDVYTGAGSIVRELVKNAYDAYLAMDLVDFESEEFKREVVISREREPNGLGRLFIADNGIGQSFDDLKANVQISISRKPTELENATGFRGLGSWASLGAGSKITISSSKKGDPEENRLTIDVRKVYSILSPETTLDDILNSKACIRMARRAASKESHFTTIEIVCDGPVESVNGHELNRLYPHTDPNSNELKKLLVQHCPIPFAQDGEVHKKIHKIYAKVGYIPTPIVLDGTTLERRVPESLTDFDSMPLLIGDHVAGIAWRVQDPTSTGEVSRVIDEDKHNLSGPAIQLAKMNVPIGPKRIYNDGHVRDGLLDWYIGEIQISASDLQPNASGDALRTGSPRDAFIPSIRSFYEQLEEEADKKSQRISLDRLFRNANQAATKLSKGRLSAIQESQERAKVAKAVEVIQVLSKRGQPGNQREKQLREAAKDPKVAQVHKETKRHLTDTGILAQFGAKAAGKEKSQTTTQRTGGKQQASASKSGASGGDKPAVALDPVAFQARVGRKIPKLQKLGLTTEQVDGVLAVIQELFEGN